MVVLKGKEFGKQKAVMPVFGCVITTVIVFFF